MKPMTSAATQAVVTAMARVSAEYIGGPSRDAPTTGPVTPPSAYAMPIPGSRPRGPRISLGKSPSGATPGTALFLATLMSFAGVMGGILLLSTKE